MKRLHIIISVFIILQLFSCVNRDNLRLSEEEVDVLIFGLNYGECFQDCFTVYKLEGENLYEDTNIKYLGDYLAYEFDNSRQLTNDQYSLVSDLRTSIPNELLTSENKKFGCPDCYDQGGVFIQIEKGNDVRRFVIDTDDSDDQSSEIVAFKDDVMKGIDVLGD